MFKNLRRTGLAGLICLIRGVLTISYHQRNMGLLYVVPRKITSVISYRTIFYLQTHYVSSRLSTKVSRTLDGNFIDYLIIKVKGGRGGDGGISFDRNMMTSRGPPNGGDGGPGGNIWIKADEGISSLGQDLLYGNTEIRGKLGGRGSKNNKSGKAGEDVIIKVPIGTEIREIRNESNILEDDTDGIIDVGNDNEFFYESFEEDPEVFEEIQEIESFDDRMKSPPIEKEPLPSLITLDSAQRPPMLLARGGRGGRGNRSFGFNNHLCERGQLGEERMIELNLKTIADVGLVGLPNAGKSSFLGAVSNAHPRVADYPFTTLNPYVGVIDFMNIGKANNNLNKNSKLLPDRITVADIPGIIEGAHANRGLGHQFLKHIVKSKILAFVIDFSKEYPEKDLLTLISELELYQEGLALEDWRARLVIANKADLVPDGATLRQKISQCKQVVGEKYGQEVSEKIEYLPVSALHGLAIGKVTERLRHLCVQERQEKKIIEFQV